MVEEKKLNVGLISIIAIVILAVLCLFLISPKTYTVKIVSGDTTYEYMVKKNGKILEPVAPEKENAKFIGWYKNDIKYDFDSLVTEDFTLVPKFESTKETVVNTTTTTKEETTTTKNENTTTTKKGSTTTKKYTTTKKQTTTTAKPTTTVKPTTTTKAVTYSVIKVPVAGSTIGQVTYYIKNNSTGSYVSGTATVTYANGSSETRSISASGWTTVGSTVRTVTNAKGN